MTDLDSRPTPAATRLAIVLLAGAAVLGIGAALHPMLPLDVPGQLDVIAQTSHWRAIHLVMIAGTVLVVIGVWGLLAGRTPAARRALRVIFAVIVIGMVLNATNIAYMAQIGTGDAARYVQGHLEAAAAFTEGHGISLTRARVGNVLIAIACAALAAVEWRDRLEPRYLALLAAVAAVGGIIGVIAFDPASRGAVAAVALFCLWAAVAAIGVVGAKSRDEEKPGRREAGTK